MILHRQKPQPPLLNWLTLHQSYTQVLDGLEQDLFKTTEVQDESLSNYAEKLSKEEAKLDWSLSAEQLERCIRAFNP